MNLDLTLTCLTPFGLFLDVVGFWLLYVFGKDVWLAIGDEFPDISERRQGNLYVRTEKNPNSDSAAIKPTSRFNFWDTDSGNHRRRKLGQIGVYLVIVGFAFQIVGSFG